jgi:DNA-binding transcriptional LysR family regulator
MVFSRSSVEGERLSGQGADASGDHSGRLSRVVPRSARSARPSCAIAWPTSVSVHSHGFFVPGERCCVHTGESGKCPPMLRQFALLGMEIAILPGHLVESEIMQGGLVQVLASYRLPRFELMVSYLRHRSVKGKIRSFIDHLTGHFDREWKGMVSEEQSGRIGPSAAQAMLLEDEPDALCSL